MSTTPNTKRARRTSPAFGRCPDCTTPLADWGLNSRGQGDRYNEIGCPICREIKFEIHTEDCGCAECAAGIGKRHRIQS